LSAHAAVRAEVSRRTLANGLRVVVVPRAANGVVGVAVVYDVGFRSEPEGRTGFAHLFEHLMFQGSSNVAKMQHAACVEGAGGVLDGTTLGDVTAYYQAVPRNALELMLFLEADRMSSVRVTQANLDNQCAVVKEEIAVEVTNRPYGGFPWLQLPAVAFDTFPNAHNGYGELADLEAATVQDAQDFFDLYYAPGNAVLAIAGDVDTDEVWPWVDRYFGSLPARRVPARPALTEPALTQERRAQLLDPLAPVPALGVAWRAPDPFAEFDAYLATALLADVLVDGPASRLQRRMVHGDGIAIGATAEQGLLGEPFAMRDPALLVVMFHHSPEIAPDHLLAVLQEELELLAARGLDEGELERVQASAAVRVLTQNDQVRDHTVRLGIQELLRAEAELVDELPDRIAAITEDQIRAAALRLRADNRAVLELVPGKR
jgi:zinc protease